MSTLVCEYLSAAGDVTRNTNGRGPGPSDPVSAACMAEADFHGSEERDPAAGGARGRSSADPDSDRDLWLYRDRTVAMLRRYLRLAVEVGRLPSLLGREFFRTRITSYHTQTFEDSVIFVHDVEGALELLDAADRMLLGMIVLQEHSQEQAASLLRCTRRTIVRRYAEALDRISPIFLKRNILARLPEKEPSSQEACQEPKESTFSVCHSA